MTVSRSEWQPFYEKLYKVYPLHQDFGGGFNAFLDVIDRGFDPEYIFERAASYAKNVGDIKYVPHLKTWLRNRRFDDEDLFTDQVTSVRQWFVGAYERADVTAVVSRYGFIYNTPPIPDNVEDLKAWHRDQNRAWIGKVARHILHGSPPPT